MTALAAALVLGAGGASAQAPTSTTAAQTTTAASTSTLPSVLEQCQFALAHGFATITSDALRCHARAVSRPVPRRAVSEHRCVSGKERLFACLAPVAPGAPPTAACGGDRSSGRAQPVCPVASVTDAAGATVPAVVAFVRGLAPRLDCAVAVPDRRVRHAARRCARKLGTRLAGMATELARCRIALARDQLAGNLVAANQLTSCEAAALDAVTHAPFVGGCPPCVDVDALANEVLAFTRAELVTAFGPCRIDEQSGTFCPQAMTCMRVYCAGDGCAGAPLDGTTCGADETCATHRCVQGTCVATPRNAGRVCSATNACLVCSDSGCDADLDCGDGNRCTDDSCDPVDGCINAPLTGASCTADTDPCTDDRCTSEGRCAATPIVCDDHDASTTDSCQNGHCVFCAGATCTTVP